MAKSKRGWVKSETETEFLERMARETGQPLNVVTAVFYDMAKQVDAALVERILNGYGKSGKRKLKLNREIRGIREQRKAKL